MYKAGMTKKQPQIDPISPSEPAKDPPSKKLPEIDPEQPNEFPLESPTDPDTERKEEIVVE